MKYREGFTLIEIIIVVAILAVIIAFGMTVDFNSFLGDTFLTEQAKIVSILERARSHAMANMYESNYGVCYTAPNYIVFKGSTCTAGESIPANTNIASKQHPL